MMKPIRRALILLVFCASTAGAQDHQLAWDTHRDYTTRPELEALLARLDSAGHKNSHQAANIALVRKRLTDGDFQMGDRILLHVEGEQQLSDTFTVDDGRLLTLPTIGAVPLSGVLRSELENYLHTQVARFIKDPVVHARELIRVGVLGDVTRPGYYLVPPTSQIEDVIMTAGGPSKQSNIGGATIRRADGEFWGSDVVQRAIAEGRTLDQLGIRSGDVLNVPSHSDFGRTVMIIGALVTIPLTIMTIAHWH